MLARKHVHLWFFVTDFLLVAGKCAVLAFSLPKAGSHSTHALFCLQDVKKHVLKEYDDKLGGVEGLLKWVSLLKTPASLLDYVLKNKKISDVLGYGRKLKIDKEIGVQSEEVPDR